MEPALKRTHSVQRKDTSTSIGKSTMMNFPEEWSVERPIDMSCSCRCCKQGGMGKGDMPITRNRRPVMVNNGHSEIIENITSLWITEERQQGRVKISDSKWTGFCNTWRAIQYAVNYVAKQKKGQRTATLYIVDSDVCPRIWLENISKMSPPNIEGDNGKVVKVTPKPVIWLPCYCFSFVEPL